MERSLGESIIRERRLTTRIKECEEEMHQLREQHEQELRNRVEESQESIVSPTEVMQDLRARYESALVDLSHHQDLSSQLQAEMTALRVDIQKGDRVRQEMSVVLESTQRELESCRGDLNTSQVQVVELKAECSALRSEIAAVTQKLQDQKEDASPPSHAPAGAPLTPISPQHQPTPNHLSSDPQIPAKAFSVSNLFVTEPPPEETPFPFSRAQTPLSLSAIEHKTDSVKSTKEVSGPVHSHAPDTTDISSVPTHQTNIPNPPDLPTIRTPTPSPPPVRGVAQPFDFLAPDANFHPPRTTSVTTLKSRACPNDRTSNPLLSQLSPPLSNPTTTASTEHVPDESLADLGTPRPIRHQPRSASVTSIKSEAYTTPSGSVESFVPTVVEPVLAQPVLNSDRLDESSTAMQNEAAIAIQTQIRGYLTRKRHPIPATAVAAAPKMATATSAQAIYDASLLPEDTVSSSAPVVEDTKIKSRTPSPVPSVIESLVESLEGFTDSESDDGSESADDLW
ncbi:hypothetical protein DFS34DRAFT_627174 [Phlyctochytrium arcticum]|nr:hypothetical protein DFS34DRAFT_640755 [Phlyctochytrium arcticum]KAI9095239.1 hypothetical protein DFS34DRAFT_627174 [Phlyctochytrium arcticum]